MSTLSTLEYLKLDIYNPRTTGSLVKFALDEILGSRDRQAEGLKVQLGIPKHYVKDIGSWDYALTTCDRNKLESVQPKIASCGMFDGMHGGDPDLDVSDYDQCFGASEYQHRLLSEAERACVLDAMPRFRATSLLIFD